MSFHFVPPMFNTLQRPPMMNPRSTVLMPPRPLRPLLTGLAQNRCLVPDPLLPRLFVRPPALLRPSVSSMAGSQAVTSLPIEFPANFDIPPPNFLLPNEYPIHQSTSLANRQQQLLNQPSLLLNHSLQQEGILSKHVPQQQQQFDVINVVHTDDFNLFLQQSNECENENPSEDESVLLDDFISDLHLEINGFEARNLTVPSGFCFCWGGVKATHGVCRGKVMYEVRILEHLPTDFGDNHIETSPHLLRIGWSMVHASLQLGEETDSWGYGGTGKFSTNNRFSDYGEPFGKGDVITALLDLDSKPASISFAKNGKWLGIASPLHGFKVDQKSQAMFPHILSKNCCFEVNFGQEAPWCPLQYLRYTYNFINESPSNYKVRGPKSPEKKSDCEVIMIVGLPGSGKTTWARKMFRENPGKMYNIIGTDDLIDKMKVMGLPRKNNYSGRWDVLIQQATSCLNKIFIIASRRLRHYIIDQTNVYASARKRKMKHFIGFRRICAVLQPEDDELKRREWKRTFEEGKVVPEEAVMEMKMNYSLPDAILDEHVDEVVWIELEKDASFDLVTLYNKEGSSVLHSRKRSNDDLLINNAFNSNISQLNASSYQMSDAKYSKLDNDSHFLSKRPQLQDYEQNHLPSYYKPQDSQYKTTTEENNPSFVETKSYENDSYISLSSADYQQHRDDHREMLHHKEEQEQQWSYEEQHPNNDQYAYDNRSSSSLVAKNIKPLMDFRDLRLNSGLQYPDDSMKQREDSHHREYNYDQPAQRRPSDDEYRQKARDLMDDRRIDRKSRESSSSSSTLRRRDSDKRYHEDVKSRLGYSQSDSRGDRSVDTIDRSNRGTDKAYGQGTRADRYARDYDDDRYKRDDDGRKKNDDRYKRDDDRYKRDDRSRKDDRYKRDDDRYKKDDDRYKRDDDRNKRDDDRHRRGDRYRSDDDKYRKDNRTERESYISGRDVDKRDHSASDLRSKGTNKMEDKIDRYNPSNDNVKKITDATLDNERSDKNIIKTDKGTSEENGKTKSSLDSADIIADSTTDDLNKPKQSQQLPSEQQNVSHQSSTQPQQKPAQESLLPTPILQPKHQQPTPGPRLSHQPLLPHQPTRPQINSASTDKLNRSILGRPPIMQTFTRPQPMILPMMMVQRAPPLRGPRPMPPRIPPQLLRQRL